MQHMRRIWIICALALIVGCSSPHQLPEAPTRIPRLDAATLPPSAATTISESESVANSQEQASASQAVDMEEGEMVFNTSCSVCHNLDDQPKVGPGLAQLFDRPLLPNGKDLDEVNMREWILNGGGTMPGVALDEQSLDDVIGFLKIATD